MNIEDLKLTFKNRKIMDKSEILATNIDVLDRKEAFHFILNKNAQSLPTVDKWALNNIGSILKGEGKREESLSRLTSQELMKEM